MKTLYQQIGCKHLTISKHVHTHTHIKYIGRALISIP